MSHPPVRPPPRQPVLGALWARLAEAPLAVAVWTGFVAAALSCLATIGIALVLWIPDADATATSTSIVHAGVITFLIAMHGGAHLNGVHIGFVPLGMTAAVVAACARLARPAWAHPRSGAESVTRIVAAQVGAFTTTCALLVPSARLGTTWVGWTGTLLGAAVVSAVGFGLAASRGRGQDLADGLPAMLAASARAAAAGVAVFLAGGAVLAAITTAVHHGRFTALSRALGGGAASMPLALLQTLTAPNAAVAGSAYLAGPGFDVGAAQYGLSGNRTGSVPAFPILAGLPSGGSTAPVAVLVLAAVTVLAAGVVAGWLAHRGVRERSWRIGVAAAALGGVLTGAGLALLTALAGGQLGEHTLRSVGASPLQMALVVCAEVGATALVTGLIARAARVLLVHRTAGAASVSVASAAVPSADAADNPAPASAASVDVAPLRVVPDDNANNSGDDNGTDVDTVNADNVTEELPTAAAS